MSDYNKLRHKTGRTRTRCGCSVAACTLSRSSSKNVDNASSLCCLVRLRWQINLLTLDRADATNCCQGRLPVYALEYSGPGPGMLKMRRNHCESSYVAAKCHWNTNARRTSFSADEGVADERAAPDSIARDQVQGGFLDSFVVRRRPRH